MTDTYQPPAAEPLPEPQQPLAAVDPVPGKELAFTAFPNATQEEVNAAETKAANDPEMGVVVNPGPQLSMNAPDEHPVEPPPPVNP